MGYEGIAAIRRGGEWWSLERFRETDLVDFEFVGDAQIAPEGAVVAYVQTVVDKEENRYRSRIFRLPFEGEGEEGEAEPMTTGPGRDFHPRWSPDGRWLAFLSDREAAKGKDAGLDAEGRPLQALGVQLYLMPATGGEALRVTDLRGGVEGFVWAPDGRRVAFVARVPLAGPRFLDEKAADDDELDENERLFRRFNADVKHHTRARYREDGVGYLEDRFLQVFVLDVVAARQAVARGEPRPRPLQLTGGPYDHAMPAWSPDGSTVAVSAARVERSDLARFTDIWLFPADGQGEPRKLTPSRGICTSPAFAPDGRTLAYLGHEREQGWYTDVQLVLIDLEAARRGATDEEVRRSLTRGFARSLEDASVVDMRFAGEGFRPTWSADGRQVLLLASANGTTHLFRVDVAGALESGSGARVERLTTGDLVAFDGSFDPRSGRVALSVGTAENPNDIYVGDLREFRPLAAGPGAEALERLLAAPPEAGGGLPLRRRTHTSSRLLQRRATVLPERFTFRSPGGPELDGWLIRPLGWREGERYPAVVEVHGGPQMMYTSEFFFEFQVLASAGFAVLYANPRGSQGYGEAFTADIRGHWGEHDYADVMALVDAALERYPWIDPERLGIAGGSYGGFMTSWVVGHTDRFRAAVSMRALNNMQSFFGTSDGGYHWDEVFGGKPWEVPDRYDAQSPITYVGRVRTPTLVLHSEEDYRCPLEQGQQMFASLQVQGVESEMFQYPGESHGLSRQGRPWHRVHRLRAIREWFERHLQRGAQPEPQPARSRR
ncbi:MAG: S9 family peptidase [Bacillota bacterium]|nr:S9 family peptidase [Bacillota bacterium]